LACLYKERELWAVKLTTANELLGVPNVKIVGNIHGNEPVGREIILHLIQVSHTHGIIIFSLKYKYFNRHMLLFIIHILHSDELIDVYGYIHCYTHWHKYWCIVYQLTVYKNSIIFVLNREIYFICIVYNIITNFAWSK